MNALVEMNDGDQAIEVSDSGMAMGLMRAEIDQQISTARAYPRSLKRVQSSILSMATLDEESAEECMYALPRGGKPIQGPSIRFAEILKQSYGNCRAAARVVSVDKREKFVEAEGVFHDLETNTATTARVRRRISNKSGALLSDDMIIVTGNAACSIALRNAILGGVPKPLWRHAYEAVQSTIAGDASTLTASRTKAISFFANFGVKPEQIYQALGVVGEEDITVDHVVMMRAMGATLKNGEATVEEMFNPSHTQPEQRPDIKDRLQSARSATQTSAGEQEGFSSSNVSAETASLSTAAPADEAEIVPTNTNPDPASDPPPNADAGQPPESTPPPETPVATNPDQLTDDKRAFLIEKMRIILAAAMTDPFDERAVYAVAEAYAAEIKAEGDLVHRKVEVALRAATRLGMGERSKDETLAYIAGIIGCEVREIL